MELRAHGTVSVILRKNQFTMKNIFLILCLALASISFAQDSKAKGILDKVSTKVKANKTLYIEFSASVKSSSGTTTTNTGKGWVKGDKFSATYGENAMISNGTKTWSVVKKEKKVYEADADEDDESINPKRLMTIWEKGFNSKYDKEETLNGSKVHVINLYPKNARTAEYHTITVYIGKDDSQLKKAVLKKKDGSTMTYSITKYTANPTVEDSKFVFDIKSYPGYTVVKN